MEYTAIVQDTTIVLVMMSGGVVAGLIGVIIGLRQNKKVSVDLFLLLWYDIYWWRIGFLPPNSPKGRKQHAFGYTKSKYVEADLSRVI
jgi:hypothetical protein